MLINLEKNMESRTWDELSVSPEILHGIYSYGFESPSEIQQRAIPPLMEGRDVIAQAPSGTGKTGAFAVAAIAAVDLSLNYPQVIILAPTHELVTQISSVVAALSSKMPSALRVKTLVGELPCKTTCIVSAKAVLRRTLLWGRRVACKT